MLLGKHVTKLYKTDAGTIHILVNSDFQINKGDFVFLTGFSGSGKSTLLKLLSGEERPIHGEIIFQNFPIHSLNEDAYLKFRQSLGVIYQDYRLIDHKNVYENIAFVLEALNYKENEAKDIIAEVLDIVGLSHRASAYPEQLSGGEKRRVTIARAIAINPILILADEPTGDLDPYNTEIIMEIMTKIAQKGTTIVMSTHHIELVQEYTDARIWYLQQGRLYKDINYDTLIEFYFKKNKVTNVESQNTPRSTRKKQLVQQLKARRQEKLIVKITTIPDIIINNIEHLTPEILEKYYDLNAKELKRILEMLI